MTGTQSTRGVTVPLMVTERLDSRTKDQLIVERIYERLDGDRVWVNVRFAIRR